MRLYTKEDMDFIIKNNDTMTNEQLSIFLNKTIKSIEKKKRNMGIFKKYPNDLIEGEEWVSMLEYPNFQISTHGRIRNKKGIMKLFLNKKVNRFQYRFNTINNIGTIQIHRFVAIYFSNPPLNYKDMVVHHIDFNPYNNYYKNLQWLSKEEHVSIHKSKFV